MHMQSTARYGHVSLVFHNLIYKTIHRARQGHCIQYSNRDSIYCSTLQLTKRDTRTRTLDMTTTFRVHIAYDDVKVASLLSSDTAHNYSCTGERLSSHT